MKFLFVLLIVLFSQKSNAEMYMAIDEILDCDNPVRQSFTRKKKCEQDKGRACRPIGKINCETMVYGDVLFNTTIKKYLKEGEVLCDDALDCQAKKSALNCSVGFTATYTLTPFTKAYCYKQDGFVQRTVRKYHHDLAKKVVYDKKVVDDAKSVKDEWDALIEIKTKVNNSESLTDSERRVLDLWTLRRVR